MNLDMIKDILVKQYGEDNLVEEYLNVCSSICNSGYTEKHHILPKSLFPQYAAYDWNLVPLSWNNHVEAHRLLCGITKHSFMISAYNLMAGQAEKLNFAKFPEVKKKISESKTGKPRPDLYGKRYFGTHKDMSEVNKRVGRKLAGTAIVKDQDGNRRRVSVTDPDYLSGKLVPFNKGKENKNSASKRPEVMTKIMETRTKNYNMLANSSADKIAEYIVRHIALGSKVFTKSGKLGGNFTKVINMSKYDYNEIYKLVVQRLSNGSIAEPSRVGASAPKQEGTVLQFMI